MKKQKMSEEKKVKLIYSGELVLIAVVFLVLGILRMLGVIQTSEKRLLIFNIITTVGGVWMLCDLIWALLSEKRRKKVCLLDKFLILPLGLYLLTYDILNFANVLNAEQASIFVPIAFFYIFVIYTFEGVYHWFKPIPGIFDDIKQEEKPVEEEQKPKENNDEEAQ